MTNAYFSSGACPWYTLLLHHFCCLVTWLCMPYAGRLLIMSGVFKTFHCCCHTFSANLWQSLWIYRLLQYFPCSKASFLCTCLRLICASTETCSPLSCNSFTVLPPDFSLTLHMLYIYFYKNTSKWGLEMRALLVLGFYQTQNMQCKSASHVCPSLVTFPTYIKGGNTEAEYSSGVHILFQCSLHLTLFSIVELLSLHAPLANELQDLFFLAIWLKANCVYSIWVATHQKQCQLFQCSLKLKKISSICQHSCHTNILLSPIIAVLGVFCHWWVKSFNWAVFSL